MKTKLIILTVVSLLITSCKTENNKKDKTEEESTSTLVEDVLELKFDNGEKWLANMETHDGVKRMDSIIKAFKTENNNEYTELGKNLSKQSSYIIKKCSMKGEPHDQLHLVLVPMLDEISILRETNNESASVKALTKMEHLISEYFTHFKIN